MKRTLEGPKGYTFDVPAELLAQEPPEARGGERSDVRLAVLDRHSGRVKHRRFQDITDYFRPDDVLVLNNARVVPTLLDSQDEAGRAVALSFHSPRPDGTWFCHAAQAAVCRAGARFTLGPDGRVTGRLLSETAPSLWHIALDPADAHTLYSLAEPVYSPNLKQPPADPASYQNTFASRPGAAGFPAAGRHFTPALLNRIRAGGTAIAEVTLLLATRSHREVRSRFRRLMDEGGLGDLDAENRAEAQSTADVLDFPPPER